MKAKLMWLALAMGCIFPSQAQQITQTIRGSVVDSESKFPLPGVNVVVLDNAGEVVKGAVTDLDGKFGL
ncbi:MAG: carboxypeptidase regulatory-like domain-containing protein [Bacteroidota bacterium]